jgi:hypothetical protein
MSFDGVATPSAGVAIRESWCGAAVMSASVALPQPPAIEPRLATTATESQAESPCTV